MDIAHRVRESLEPASLDRRDRVGFLGEPIGKHLQGNAALAGVEEFGEESTCRSPRRSETDSPSAASRRRSTSGYSTRTDHAGSRSGTATPIITVSRGRSAVEVAVHHWASGAVGRRIARRVLTTAL
jgi:hypothetical protein